MTVEVFAFGDQHTPEQVLLKALQDCKEGSPYKSVIVVAIDEDDYITSGWSNSSALSRLGMLDMCMERIRETMHEDE